MINHAADRTSILPVLSFYGCRIVHIYRVMNYNNMSIYGSSVIYAIDLYHVMNCPTNIKESFRNTTRQLCVMHKLVRFVIHAL